MSSLEKIYLFLLFMILIPAIAFAGLYSSEKERANALETKVNAYSGWLADTYEEINFLREHLSTLPTKCILWPEDLYKDAIILPLYKYAHRESTGDDNIDSIDCK